MEKEHTHVSHEDKNGWPEAGSLGASTLVIGIRFDYSITGFGMFYVQLHSIDAHQTFSFPPAAKSSSSITVTDTIRLVRRLC